MLARLYIVFVHVCDCILYLRVCIVYNCECNIMQKCECKLCRRVNAFMCIGQMFECKRVYLQMCLLCLCMYVSMYVLCL